MVTLARIQQLIESGTPCRVTHSLLGTGTEVVRFGVFTGAPGGPAVELSSVFIDGAASPTVIQDVAFISEVVELEESS